MELWGDFPLPGNEVRLHRIGPLHLWMKTISDDLWYAYRHYEGESGGVASRDETAGPETPTDESWFRCAMQAPYDKIRITPCFPDRPVVVKTESSISIAPGGSVDIFVRCPLWIRLELVDRNPVRVAEIPSVVLSDSWFGSNIEGDLCYWISSSARRRIEADPSRPFLAICPVQVRNQSSEELVLERICLRVGMLALFDLDGQFHSDQTTVEYKGGKLPSEVETSGMGPSGSRLVSQARFPTTAKLAAKTFRTLRELVGLDD